MNPEKIKVRGFHVFQPKLGHVVNLHKHNQSGYPYDFPAIHSGQWFHDAFTPSSPIWLWSRMSSAIVWLIRRAWAKAWKNSKKHRKPNNIDHDVLPPGANFFGRAIFKFANDSSRWIASILNMVLSTLLTLQHSIVIKYSRQMSKIAISHHPRQCS